VTSLPLVTDSANSYQGPTTILDAGVTIRDNTEKILALGACILAGEKQKQSRAELKEPSAMHACVRSHFSHVRLFVNLVDSSPPGSSVHRALQARIPEWVAMPSSGGPSLPRDQTSVPYASCTGKQVLYP